MKSATSYDATIIAISIFISILASNQAIAMTDSRGKPIYREEMAVGPMNPSFYGANTISAETDRQPLEPTEETDPERWTEEILNKFLLMFGVHLREKILQLHEKNLFSSALQKDMVTYYAQLSKRCWELFRHLTPQERKIIIHHPEFNSWSPVTKRYVVYRIPPTIARYLDNAIFRQLQFERPDLKDRINHQHKIMSKEYRIIEQELGYIINYVIQHVDDLSYSPTEENPWQKSPMREKLRSFTETFTRSYSKTKQLSHKVYKTLKKELDAIKHEINELMVRYP